MVTAGGCNHFIAHVMNAGRLANRHWQIGGMEASGCAHLCAHAMRECRKTASVQALCSNVGCSPAIGIGEKVEERVVVAGTAGSVGSSGSVSEQGGK